MRKLFPILLALIGLGAGVGAGLMLKPAAEAEAAGHGEAAEAAEGEAAAAPDAPDPPAEGHAEAAADGHDAAAPAEGHDEPAEGEATEEYVKLNNQFVVPVVSGGRVGALVVLSVSLQVGAGTRDAVFAREPKLRDGFLQVLFDHANSGGFDGVFTSAANLRTLRLALLEAAQSVLGETVTDILITDMMRQEG